MAIGTCTVDGCGKHGRVILGMCEKHYERNRRHGDPSIVLPKNPNVRGVCKVGDCTDLIEAHGYCRVHYRRFMKHGTPELPIREVPVCSVCGERAKARGYCEMHYQRWKKHGDPLNDGTRPLAERLAARLVRTENGCLEWTGATLKGYGQIGDGQQLLYTHRVAYALANGPIPDDLKVLHRCDNPPCCEPDHLFVGTTQDNTDDMIAKGRGAWQRKALAPRCGEPVMRTRNEDPRPCMRPIGHSGRHKSVLTHGSNGFHLGCRCDVCCRGRKVCSRYADEAGEIA